VARAHGGLGGCGVLQRGGGDAEPLVGIDLYVAPDRQKHGDTPAPPPTPDDGTVRSAMRAKLQTAAGHAVYASAGDRGTGVRTDQSCPRLPALLVPGIRQGPGGVQLICLTHNLLKLFGGVAPPGGVTEESRQASPERARALREGYRAPAAG